MRNRKPEENLQAKNCLNCSNSFSLPTGETFDDGTVCVHDRLVCMLSRKIVAETDFCKDHSK